NIEAYTKSSIRNYVTITSSDKNSLQYHHESIPFSLKNGAQVIPNKRDDLWLQPGERKVSGTAARIANGRAYHHMTLLMGLKFEWTRQ
uniref:BPL/LPL catalytic domain-containing protein n=1 Tax=Parascaris equorum TaxID=6256 RepID=A0A914R1Z1_PAREQ